MLTLVARQKTPTSPRLAVGAIAQIYQMVMLKTEIVRSLAKPFFVIRINGSHPSLPIINSIWVFH